MRQVLTHVHHHIRPGGGPAGYLYNLATALGQLREERIRVVTTDVSDVRAYDGTYISWGGRLRRALPRPVAKRLALYAEVTRWMKWTVPETIRKMICEDEAVVFHDVRMAAAYTRTCEVPGQRVFVMPHSPADYTTEFLMNVGCNELRMPGLGRVLGEWEMRAYERCTGLVVPCLEALDGYFCASPLLRSRLGRLQKHPIPTGAPALRPRLTRDQARRTLGVSESTCLVGFVGRYHWHKGFDIYLETVSHNIPGVTFISAGNGPIAPLPDTESYRNLGWRSVDIADVMNALDVLVVPNRVTYLDLVILEAFSLGKAVVSTRTGGNKWLATKTPGLVLVDEISSSGLAKALRSKSRDSWIRLGRFNEEAYSKMFTMEHMIQRYVSLLRTLRHGQFDEL